VPANKLLIADNAAKLRQNKRTSRWKVSIEFHQVTELMVAMLEVLKTVQLQPVNCSNTVGLANYYIEVNEWQRLAWDTSSDAQE
jgi:hypothetical protein